MRKAATVVLLRSGSEGLEALLLRRARGHRFMPGAHVFPGGRLDATDSELAQRFVQEPPWQQWQGLGGDAVPRAEALGLFAAALRELFEETGVLLAAPLPPPEERAQARARLVGGEPEALAALLAAHDSRLCAESLAYWAHWITPSAEPRRYDTRFFVAACPQEQGVSLEGGELTELQWLRPEAALKASDAGEVLLPPPTVYTLRELQGYGDPDAVLAAAGQRRVAPILPKLQPAGEGVRILLPWHSDYAAAHGEGVTLDGVHPQASAVAEILWRLTS